MNKYYFYIENEFSARIKKIIIKLQGIKFRL